MAKLYFKYGAMGSGKTIDLLKVAYNYEEKGKRVLLLSPTKDDRDGVGVIKTRIGLKRQSLALKECDNLYEIVKSQKNMPDAVIVDESQFLSKEQVYQLSDVVDFFNIPVMCYGIRTDFKGNTFEGSHALFEIADSIEEIKTICECGNKATMNMRVIDGKPTLEGKQIFVGGNESYVSICRKCYKKYFNLQK